MKQTKFIQPKIGWHRVLALLGLSLISILPSEAQMTPPDDFLLKVKFDQQTKFQVALFSPTDLEKLSVLDKMSLTQSNESSTVEIFYQKEDRITSHTTFFKTPANEKSWLPFVKYSVLDGRTVQLFNEQRELLQKMDLGKDFEAYTKMASALVSGESRFKFPTAFDYDDMAENYENQGFSVTSLAEGKVWIENPKSQIEMDLPNKMRTIFSKDDLGAIKRIETTRFATLTSGQDVPAFTETIEYNQFPNGVCYQNIRTDRFLNYKIESPEVEERKDHLTSAKELNLCVSPNPVANRLYIQGTPAGNDLLWGSISDLTGTIYRKLSIAPQSLSAGIDVADLHSGVYLLTIGLPHQVKTIKFIKL